MQRADRIHLKIFCQILFKHSERDTLPSTN